MSSSWKISNYKQIKRTPSPTLFQVVINRISRVYKKIIILFMERISVFTYRRNKKIKASMTVEAAVVLPLLLFFFLHIMSAVEMLRLHGKLTFALWECGNQLTVYAAMPDELGAEIPDIAVSYLYVKNRVEKFLGKEYLEQSPLKGGGNGINYLAADYDGGCIDIGISYLVTPQITVFPMGDIRLTNRYYAKAWDGYDNAVELRFVYVTVYGEVWHKTLDCTHIHHVIKETEWSRIEGLRNTNGRRYSACELCKEEEKGRKTYFTDQGDRYHRISNCPALVRYIRAIMWEDGLPYNPCSRCAGGE